MEIGTAIFLSSLMFAVIALYGITKDRWHWGTMGQIFSGLVIGIIMIVILGLIMEQIGIALK
jgi:FtsH-binding integral membrane protein